MRVLILVLFSIVLSSCSISNQDIQVDVSANQESSGSTSSDLDSDSDTSQTTDTTSSYVKKVLAWITQLGETTKYEPGGFTVDNSADDICYSTVVDDDGNIYCAGSTSGSIGDDNVISGGSNTNDAFVLKLNSNREIQWIQQFGSNSGDACFGLAIDSQGYLYCGGETTGDLGEVNAGGSDAFITKLNSTDGSIEWIKQLGVSTVFDNGEGFTSDNTQNDSCNSIAIDSEDNIYCGGDTTGDLGEANGDGGGATSTRDFFIMKINSSGTIQWISQVGLSWAAYSGSDTSQDDICQSIAIDSEDNVYCGGDTRGSLGETKSSGIQSDTVVVKLNSSGAVQWITQLGDTTKLFSAADNTGASSCSGIAIDSQDNIFCGGFTTSFIGVGGMVRDPDDAIFDGYVMKLSNEGELLWINQFGDNYDYTEAIYEQTYCADVAIDSKDNVYCTGHTSGGFGEASAIGDNDPVDSFVISFNNDGWPLDAFQLGAVTKAYDEADHTLDDKAHSIVVDSDDNIYVGGVTYGALGEANAHPSGDNTDLFIMKLE